MAPADIGLAGFGLGNFGLADGEFTFIQARLQHLHRGGAVLVLASLILAGDDHAGGHVRDAHGGIGGVHVLAASTGGAIGIDLEIRFLDVDVDFIVHLRIDPHAGKAGVPPGRAVVGADAHQTVDAALGLGPAIGLGALHQKGGVLDAGGFTRVEVHQLNLVAVFFGPALIHAQQHRGPILAFGTTSAAVDFDIGVVVVGFARQQGGHLVHLRLRGQRLQSRNAIIGQRLVPFHFGELDQLARIGQVTLDSARGGYGPVQPTTLGHQRLGGLGIVPQLRVFNPRVQFIETAKGAIPVKETSSAGPAPA